MAMHLLFLIPLTTSLIAVYISQQQADNEIGYLTGALTVISLVISLILAPWQLQLLILFLAIISVRRFWQQLENGSEFKEAADELLKTNVSLQPAPSTINGTDGKLIKKYRGVSYELTPSLPTVPQDKIEGKYRGTSVQSVQAEDTVSAPKANLKYRGISLPSK